MRSSRSLCPWLADLTPTLSSRTSPPSCMLIPLSQCLIWNSFLSRTKVANLLSKSQIKNLPSPFFLQKLNLLWCLLTVESSEMTISESAFLPAIISLCSAKETSRQCLDLFDSFQRKMGLSTIQGRFGLGIFTVKYRLPSRQTLKGRVLPHSSQIRGFQVMAVALPMFLGFIVLVSQVCTQRRWTYLDDPAQLQGAIKGFPGSAVSKQNLQTQLPISLQMIYWAFPYLVKFSQSSPLAVISSSSSFTSSSFSIISLTLTLCLPILSISPSLITQRREGNDLTAIHGCCFVFQHWLTIEQDFSQSSGAFFFSAETRMSMVASDFLIRSWSLSLSGQGVKMYQPNILVILVYLRTLSILRLI